MICLYTKSKQQHEAIFFTDLFCLNLILLIFFKIFFEIRKLLDTGHNRRRSRQTLKKKSLSRQILGGLVQGFVQAAEVKNSACDLIGFIDQNIHNRGLR
jgi:hypothetical protein